MPLSSWLFIRGSQSVWVERPFDFTLIVCGPGKHRERRDFVDDEALNAFQVELAERLAGEGWFLGAHDIDRRGTNERPPEERPQGLTARRETRASHAGKDRRADG
jgi:hypothetical protein